MNAAPPTERLILFSFPRQRAIKYLVAALGFWALALIIYAIPDLDHQILLLFNNARANNALFASFWCFYTKNMPHFVGAFMLVLYLASFKVARLKPFRIALFVGMITYVIGNTLVDQLKVWVSRPRPFLTYPDINTLYESGLGMSFPSGHAFVAFAEILALAMALVTNDANFKPTRQRYIAALLLLAIAVSISLSRIFVGVHYLTDILGSVGIVIILEVGVIVLVQKALEKQWL